VEAKKFFKIWTDGGSRGNPGPAAIGVVIQANGQKQPGIKKCIGTATNNVAEYSAVLEALDHVQKTAGTAKIDFFIDSELVVKQLKGEYRVKDPGLKSLFLEARQKVMKLGGEISFTHVRREHNSEADKLVNEALDEAKPEV
jgi:ribonuclease HI